MAERPTGYGMTAELQDKKEAKFNVGDANEAFEWIAAVLQTGSPEEQALASQLGNVSTPKDVQEPLKDGIILCHLINILRKGSVAKINTSKMAFKQMENVGNFLDGCQGYGVPKSDMFQTVDLYEAQNIPQVVKSIHALGRAAQKNSFDGPVLGPKESTGEKREFTEEQLQAGKGVIGLQMGSNKGASQSGMTPYGLGRQIEKTN